MITAIALDDEPLALKVIETFCARLDFIRLEKTFTKTAEAHRHLRKQPVDLIFLDIQMPTQNGMDFFKSVEQDTMVIFTTAFSEYAVEGFDVDAVDYLLKPFSYDRFVTACEKARSRHDKNNPAPGNEPQYLFIRADYSLHKILLTDILFVEGLDDYLKIHIEGQKTIVARMTMKAMLEKLPAADFIRVHRSFIVPIARIEKVRNKIISIGPEEIPLSATYESEFNAIINSR
jgi:DNA-binding LytR/AlgR family response regulator